MDRIEQYVTVRHGNFNDLDTEVNKRLDDGWQLYGNPYVTDGDDEFLVCQAMVAVRSLKSSKTGSGVGRASREAFDEDPA